MRELTSDAVLDAAFAWHRFVIRTDVRAYYEHIDHGRLLDALERYVPGHDVRRLLVQVVRRTVERGGLYRDIQRGIGRGSPLSPLFGALYLKPLDDALDRAGCHFVRYMDDILILAPTRWRLRRAVRQLNQVLDWLGLDKHPDKTWIGPIDRGFAYMDVGEGREPGAEALTFWAITTPGRAPGPPMTAYSVTGTG